MSWKIDEIFATRKERAAERYAQATHDDLVNRIAELEATMWPFVVTLSCLDEKAWRGTTMTSKLFPESLDDTEENDGKFWVYDPEGKKHVAVALAASDLHSTNYVLRSSIDIADGAELSDDFEVIATHQQEPATYVFGGAIWMADIRRAVDVVFRGNGFAKDTTP